MTHVAAVFLLVTWFPFLAALDTKAKFTSTWKAPGAPAVAYAGKKVVGLIVSDDLSLRMSTRKRSRAS